MPGEVNDGSLSQAPVAINRLNLIKNGSSSESRYHRDGITVNRVRYNKCGHSFYINEAYLHCRLSITL